MSQPAWSVRLRRAWRMFRTQQPRSTQALTAALVVLLVADLVAVAATGSSSPATHTSGAAASVSAGERGSGAGGGPAPTARPGGSATVHATAGGTESGGASGVTTGGIVPGGSPAGGTTAGTPGSGPAGTGGGTTAGTTGPLPALGHGVTATSIKVVFPIPNLGAVSSVVGVYGSSEDNALSIQAAVDAINDAGGIGGRKIDPEIVPFNPLDDASMRALCLQWTQDQHVFAVVDADAWHDDNQLCITQENHTPLISSWTTVPDWTTRGNPNLWWTGPDVREVLDNLVAWAVGQHQLAPATKFAVVSADRESDSLAVGYLNRALGAAGLKSAASGTMRFDLSDSAQAVVQAQDLVSQFRSKGITTVIPLLPYTDFLYFVQAAQQQGWVPHWLLSDYEFEDQSALGLIDPSSGGPYAKELNNVSNPTFFDLGNCDCAQSLPVGYDTFGAQCNAAFNKYSGAAWRKMDAQQGNSWSGYIETTGTAMTWCTNTDIFAAAARMVPPGALTQANFDAAMEQLTHFPGQLAPDYEFSASRRAGPHEFRVVEEHVNSDGKCPKKVTGDSQGDCWLIQQDWQPEVATP